MAASVERVIAQIIAAPALAEPEGFAHRLHRAGSEDARVAHRTTRAGGLRESAAFLRRGRPLTAIPPPFAANLSRPRHGAVYKGAARALGRPSRVPTRPNATRPNHYVLASRERGVA